MLGQALAHLHWTPETFWSCTPHEFYAACEASDPKKKLDEMTPAFAALQAAHAAKDAAAMK